MPKANGRVRSDAAGVLLVALDRHHRQGVHPAQARPPHLRHDHRHPGAAADPVRLRHQRRPEAPADRGAGAPIRARTRAACSRRCRPAATSGSTRQVASEDEIEDLLAHGRVQFAVTIPENFGSKLVRGERPVLLVEADASDPVRHRQRDRGARRSSPSRRWQRDLQGPLAELAAARAAVRRARAPPLQPRRRHRLQHRARADRHDPHHDHGADDRPRHDARARARHLREPAVHAGAADRGDDRQDRALHPDRADPGHADHRRRAAAVRGADAGQSRCCCTSSCCSSSPPT